MACLRVSEVARLQVGNVWFDHLVSHGVPGFEGTCSVHIDLWKNDTQSKGHYPAFGRSRDAVLDVVVQLLQWMRATGLVVHPDCAKRARPAARCEVCPQLFQLTRCTQGGITVVTSRPCSRQQASDWIRWAVKQSGGDSPEFKKKRRELI